MQTYKVKPKLIKNKKTFPQNKRKFSEANSEADVEEKREYKSGYSKLKKIEKKLGKNEILGHINKKGKVTLSKKVPKKLRNEVVKHEKIERKKLLNKK